MIKGNLQDRWLALCGAIGRDGTDQWRIIQTAYTAADRAYHNLSHIEDCLARFDEHAELAVDPVAVEMAIWFHDLVYETKKSNNEERSAEAAVEFLRESSMAGKVSDLIRATKHDLKPTSQDAAFICDIDLSILGRDSVRYRDYAEAIREEYGWVPRDDYAAGRAKLLQSFLHRDFIYLLPPFRERYELKARSNLTAEIVKLTNSAKNI